MTFAEKYRSVPAHDWHREVARALDGFEVELAAHRTVAGPVYDSPLREPGGWVKRLGAVNGSGPMFEYQGLVAVALDRITDALAAIKAAPAYDAADHGVPEMPACPKCGKTGRGLAMHIKHCAGKAA